MIDSPTLILEDDERTVVSPLCRNHLDGMSCHMNPEMEVKPFRAAVLLVLAVLVAGIVGFLAAWLVHERQAATLLREQLQRVATGPHHLSEREPSRSIVTSPDRTGAAPRLDPGRRSDAVEDRLRDGVNLLVENRFLEALHAYRELHALLPDDTVVAEIVTVIEAKLGCHVPQEEGGSQC